MRRNATRAELANIGCLVILGLIGLALVLPVTLVIGTQNIVHAINYVDWTSFNAFRRSLWNWVHSASSLFQASIWVLGLCYCLLVWQWVAQMYGWRRFLSGKLLWGTSSIYFLVLDGLFIRLAIQHRQAGPEVFGIILMPVVFLMLTLPLWWMRTKNRDGR